MKNEKVGPYLGYSILFADGFNLAVITQKRKVALEVVRALLPQRLADGLTPKFKLIPVVVIDKRDASKRLISKCRPF